MIDSRCALQSAPWQQATRRERVAFCVTSGEARSVVLTALRSAGIEPVPALPLQLYSTLSRPHAIDALIHDLHPWDLSIVGQLEAIRTRYPDLPILIYAPVRPGIADLLVRCAHLPSLHAELQQSADGQQSQRVRRLLRLLIDEVPSTRLLRILETAVPNAPPRAWSFTRMALQHVCRGARSERPTVRGLANKLGVSERTLERSWPRSVLPAPKEMLAWLILLLVTLTATASRTSAARVAHGLGLDSQHLYRIRRKLLPVGMRTSDFEAVLLAFYERCRAQVRSRCSSIRGQLKMTKVGKSFAMSVSTSTRYASMPRTAAERTRASTAAD